MVREFEEALIQQYVPYLVPELKDIKFSAEVEALLWDHKFKQYPSVLVNREDVESPLTEHYTFTDDAAGTDTTVFPYDQPYTITVFTEKQSEAIEFRNKLRVRYAKEAYVKYTLGGTRVHTGLRLLSTRIASEADNYNEKGARRVVQFRFQARLVVAFDENIPIIHQVKVRISEGAVPQVMLVDEIKKENLISKIINKFKF